MDFWDLTKLLVRRWYFSVPALVLTTIATLWTVVGVSPNYVALSYVQLAPPISKPTPDGQPSLEQRNPWIGLGLYNLASAAMLTVQQEAMVESLRAAGYSESFTATLDSGSPLVTFEVTGSTREQAVSTTAVLIERFSTNVTELQVTTYNVTTEDLVVARRIDLGTNVTESDARVKRAMVAVAGLGLLLTLAFTLGMDALLSRIARRRAGLPPGVGTTDLSPPPVAPTGPATRQPSGRSRYRGDEALPPGPRSIPELRLDMGVNGAGATPDRRSDRTPAIGSAADDSTRPAGDGQDSDDPDDAQVLTHADATVVLPLTYRPWRRHETDDEGGHPR